MEHATALIIVQAILVILSLYVVVLRCWTRLYFERRTLSVSDYCAWIGWVFAVGWFVSSAIAADIIHNNDVTDEEGLVHDVKYLKAVLIAEYCFDIGIYWPKLSITAFYWHLIPDVFRSLRIALYTITTYLVCCLIVAFLLNTLIAGNISNNWSIENQLLSAWNSFPNFITQWCMNFSTDLLLFCFPFSILNHLKLRKEQKLGLIGVFSLGAITITVNLTRFIMNNLASFQLDDASGNTLCTAEMTTAVIIVCLPGLKKLIKRSKLSTQTDNSSQSGLGVATVSSAPLKSQQTTQSYADWGVKDCDIELVPEGEDYLRMPDLVVLKSQGP
ncbi:unnamed protein product [Fusarium venenatum]|uniref:Rhodopsin domain-containing protein n=1 Tax=Fusarium venenatum TaxID=56646 RepID=A0A2L2TIS1_9HYPO|nr:uncharacterized protein FVRRES_08000 [Fusarium venenatum]CEI67923.1 unnamed protein product [Fusarium venenatum]